MKQLVKAATLLIILSGLLLTPWLLGSQEIAVWVHLLLGFGYTVLFLLFGFDHISSHLAELQKKTTKNLTGITQSVSGGLTLISGFVLYLYGSEPMTPWTEVHLGSTLIFFVAVVVHFFQKKAQETA
ncbi:MAG: hypothetical protein RRB13_02270 [bacterium]|nr:hypothetical protein [bacterium]